MKNKIYQLIFLLLFASSGVLAQTVKIHDVTRSPGNILVQVDMNGFTGSDKMVASIDLRIKYDEDLLAFEGVTDTQLNGYWVANASNGQINVIFNAPLYVGYNINGKLLDLQFAYNGGFTGLLDFTAGSEVANLNFEVIPTTYLDGSVTQSATSNTVTMVSPEDGVLVGTTAEIPVKIQGPANVNAITLKIAYDPDQLVYTGKDELAITGVVATASGGLLTLEWFGSALSFATETVLLDLQFTYNGGGNAALEFKPGSEIAYLTETLWEPYPINYADALVEPAFGEANLTIETKDVTPGTNVTLNVDAAGFGSTPVGAITLKIGFNPAKLTYTGFTAIQPTSGWTWTVNASGDVLTLQRIGLTGFEIENGPLVDISFNYNGGGTAPVVFSAGTILETAGFETIPVEFINGGVNPADHPSKLILGQVAALTGEYVQVPITAEGFTDDVAAITLKIGYPAGDLVYTGWDLINTNFTGWKVGSTANQITLSWSNLGTGVQLQDGELLRLNFRYDGTGLAPVVFNPGVLLKDPLGEIIPISMVDGFVAPSTNLDLKVYLQGIYDGGNMMRKAKDHDGSVAFDRFPGTVADQITVQLHDKDDYSIIVWSLSEVDLNTDGTASLSVPAQFSGEYYLTILHRNHIETVSADPIDFSPSSVSYDFSNAINKAFGDNMADLGDGNFAIFVGDVRGDGSVNILDRGDVVVALLAGVRGYVAEDLDGDGFVTILDRGTVQGQIGKSTNTP